MTSLVLFTFGQYRSSPSTTCCSQRSSFRNRQQETYFFSQRGILFQELNYTVGQLWVVHAEALDLVQWEKYAGKEELVLFFEW
jgi:hypothetical protein